MSSQSSPRVCFHLQRSFENGPVELAAGLVLLFVALAMTATGLGPKAGQSLFLPSLAAGSFAVACFSLVAVRGGIRRYLAYALLSLYIFAGGVWLAVPLTASIAVLGTVMIAGGLLMLGLRSIHRDRVS